MNKSSMAAAVMAAIKPLVKLLLELGVTSPQAESLLRGVFVHEARSWLAKQAKTEVAPSDARIALVTGVHRNFVREILSERPKIAKNRQQKRNGADQLLAAWHSDPNYLDGSGRPRDLPTRGDMPSFQTIAATYLSGSAPGVVLDELRRAGSVQLLPGDRVRIRTKALRTQGINLSSISDVGGRTQEFVETLIHNLQFPADRRYVDSTHTIEIEADRVAVVREVINQRAATFLARMEQEFAGAAHASKKGGVPKESRKISLTVFATER